MHNLAEVPEKEQREFINSFDHVLCDLDGVIWLVYESIPGAADCVATLKKLGKKVHYVTNNSISHIKAISDKLNKHKIIADAEDIASPIFSVASRLKQIHFNKKLYCLTSSNIKNVLKEAGFQVAEDGPNQINESLQGIMDHVHDDTDVGGVIVDLDFNVNYIKLQKAITYLKRKDCLFLACAADPHIPVGGGYGVLLGPNYFINILTTATGKEVSVMGKPDPNYNDFIMDRFKIPDLKRVLFIGDTVNEDMNFATKCGYKKLLTLSGVTKKEHVTNWTYPEEYKPHYYVDSMCVFNEIIEKLYSTKNK